MKSQVLKVSTDISRPDTSKELQAREIKVEQDTFHAENYNFNDNRADPDEHYYMDEECEATAELNEAFYGSNFLGQQGNRYQNKKGYTRWQRRPPFH